MKKNKIVKIFIVILLLISMQIPSIAATTGVIKSDTVRIREDATTDSDIIGIISIGKKVTIIGEKNNWYRVKAKDDHGKSVEGYIRNDLLTVEGDVTTDVPNEETPDTPQTPTENPIENNTTTPSEVIDGNQNPVDNTSNGEEPSENEPGENVPGEEVPGEDAPSENNPETPTEITTNSNITNVKDNDKTISTLKLTSGVNVGKKVKLTEETKIKILPSVNSSNIAKLSANTEVTILEVINKWCRVETEGACGWVRIDQ